MSASLPITKLVLVKEVIVVCDVPKTKSKVLSPSSYVTVIPVSVLLPTIAPTVSEIVSAKVAPLTVIASASNVPSISTLPEISKSAIVAVPVIVGAVKVLFVRVAVEVVETKTPSLPDGSVRTLFADSECGAPISV